MEQFRKKLVEFINGSDLPFDAKYYIIKDIYRDIFELYLKMLEEQEKIKNTTTVLENKEKIQENISTVKED